MQSLLEGSDKIYKKVPLKMLGVLYRKTYSMSKLVVEGVSRIFQKTLQF